jgi:hypothetical protein
MSTLANALDNGKGIARWEKRHAAVGVAASPDLAALIAAMGSDLNKYSDTDKAELDAILERAHDRSGGNQKADYGTAVHSLTDPERDPLALDDGMVRDVAAYDQLVEQLGLEVVETEVFVINDDICAAGTFDHAYRLTRDLVAEVDGKTVILAAGTIIIGDKKTGSLHLPSHRIQLAGYARGKKVDVETWERTPLDVSPEWGVVMHIARGEGRAAAYLVNLHDGWQAAKLASQVHALHAAERKVKPVKLGEVAPPEPTDPAPALAVVTPAVGYVETIIEANTEKFADAIEKAAASAAEFSSHSAQITEKILAAKKADVDAIVEVTAVAPIEVDYPMTNADAVANLARAGLGPQDLILRDIAQAPDRAACHALWGKYRREWNDTHTEAVKARLAELENAA